jgi:hypothetical protein
MHLTSAPGESGGSRNPGIGSVGFGLHWDDGWLPHNLRFGWEELQRKIFGVTRQSRYLIRNFLHGLLELL